MKTPFSGHCGLPPDRAKLGNTTMCPILLVLSYPPPTSLGYQQETLTSSLRVGINGQIGGETPCVSKIYWNTLGVTNLSIDVLPNIGKRMAVSNSSDLYNPRPTSRGNHQETLTSARHGHVGKHMLFPNCPIFTILRQPALGTSTRPWRVGLELA